LDVATGAKLGEATTGKGVDIIAYAPKLRHLYVPAGGDATLTVIGVERGGTLRVLGNVPVAKGASCVTADARGQAYVCDPTHGRLWVVKDSLPVSQE
jgi:hypothetical protein